MKRFVGLAVFVALIGVFFGCADDVFVEPPPSLIGDYAGTYSFKVGNTPAILQDVTWRFTTQTYTMRVTGTSGDTISCNCAGDYELGNNVDLQQVTPVLDPFTCDQGRNPKGVFGLDQSAQDTVFLRRVSADTTQELILVIQ